METILKLSVSEGNDKYSNIPVRWSLINDVGTLSVISGGLRAQFLATKAGLGHIEIENNGNLKRINLNITPVPVTYQTTLSSPSISNITDAGFDIEMSFTNDTNSNATAILYYCNETSSPGCNPISGTSLNMTKSGNQFSSSIGSLTNSLQDQYNILVVVSDADGVNNEPSQSTVNLLRLPVTTIYRSVGPGSTTAVDTFSTGSLTISGTSASFSASIADNVGVGDVIVYNSNANYAIISSRVDSQNFSVFLADGKTTPTSTTTDTTWGIYRAYTSLADAERGDENTGIPNVAELTGSRNFDTWSAGRDLVANNEQWNIAHYSDGADGQVTLQGWTTAESHFLKIYSPYLPSEVGTSQRHQGVWSDSKSRLVAESYSAVIWIDVEHIVLDGLQVDNIDEYEVSAQPANGIRLHNGASSDSITITNSIITKSNGHWPVTGGSGACVSIYFKNNGILNLANNILYNCDKGLWMYINGASTVVSAYIYNNTFVDNDTQQIRINGFGLIENIFLRNNIVSLGGTGYSDLGSPTVTSEMNIFSDATGTVNDKNNQNVIFNSKETFDYRLAGNSYNAIGTGTDLSSDSDFPVTTDIFGATRTRWDVGASTAPRAIFRSVGPSNSSSLKGTADRELSIAVNSDGHTQLTLSGGTTNLPLNVGVGDVFQYDEDSVGGVDSLAFISQRIDQNNYIVKAADGTNAEITLANSTNWDIFRAYTSLGNVNNVTENTGISAGLVDFDSLSRLDLVSTNSQLYLPLYADAAQSKWRIMNYSSYGNNFLKLYAPNLSSEVGVTQRHSGVWDNTKARIADADYYGAIYIGAGACLSCRAIRIDGVQVNNSRTGTGEGHGIYYNGRYLEDTYFFTNNIITKTVEQKGIGLRFRGNKSTSYIVNNLIYGFNGGIKHNINTGDGGKAVIYNNTIDDSTEKGIEVIGYGVLDSVYLKNNIMKDSILNDYISVSGIEVFESDSNITYDSTSPDGASFQNQTVNFVDSLNEDYNLDVSDSAARGRAVDLSDDENYAFDVDIKNTARTTWDIGAHAY